VTIGFLHRITSGGVSLGSFWESCACAGLLAIQHANKRDTSIIAEFGSLTKTYSAISTDTKTGESGTIAGYRAARAGGAKGIVGPAISATNVYAGHLGGLDKFVTMGFWTSSPTVSDATTFPYLARVYHADTIRAVRMIDALRLFNFSSFGIINTDDAWANALVGLIRTEAEKPNSGVSVVNSFSFDYGVEKSVRTAVDRLANMNSPVNIIFALIFEVDLEAACDEAQSLGLLDEGYVWMDGQGLSSRPLAAASAGNRSKVGRCLNGWLQTASTLPPGGFERLAAQYVKMTPSDCANPLFTPTASLFTVPNLADLAVYEYDAAAAMILALDSLAPADESDGDLLRAAVGKLDFAGSSGQIRFEANLDRDISTADLVIYNVIYDITADEIEWRPVYNFDGSAVATIYWPGNTTTTPVDITQVVPSHNRNFINEGLAFAALGLTGITMFMAVFCICWTIAYRKTDAVKSAQPIFLILIAIGTMISVSVTFTLTQDHRTHDPDVAVVGYPDRAVPPAQPGSFSALDSACSLTLWLYIIGFDITYGSLFVKLWRIKKIFVNPQIGRGPVRIRQMLTYIFVFLAINLGVLAGLSQDSPLFYVVSIVSTNPYGIITESRGECTSSTGVWPWLGVLIGIHGGLLFYSNLVVYQLRTVPSEFNEGKYVGVSLVNNLQTSVLALMLLFLVSDTPMVAFLVKWFEAYWSATVTLLMMFIPKMAAVHLGEDDDFLAAANRMRKATKRHKGGGYAGETAAARTSAAAKGGEGDSRRSSDVPEPPAKERRRSTRKSTGMSALVFELPIEKQATAASVARDLLAHAKRQTPVGEWLASTKGQLLAEESLDAQADAVAHLLLEGKHLRSLKARSEPPMEMVASSTTGQVAPEPNAAYTPR